MLISKMLKLCHVISKDEYKLRKEIEIVKHSSFFDEKWYLERYPDVKKSGKDAATYYCTEGWRLGHNPGPNFNASFYLSKNPDISKQKQNPLVHYEKHGKWEKRSGIPVVPIVAPSLPKKKKAPKDFFFSIVVAGYNCQDFIKETLDSLVHQTYKNFEIIVVDNGSKDDSVKIIKKYTKKYPFIKLFQHKNGENRGLPETISLGIQKAEGEYIAFCNSGDLWTSNHLIEINYRLNSENNIHVVLNDIETFGDETCCANIAEKLVYVKQNIITRRGDISDDMFATSDYILTFSALCARRDLLRICNFTDIPDKTSLTWWLGRQICYNNPIHYIDKKLTDCHFDSSDASSDFEDDIGRRTEFIEKLNQIMDKYKYDSIYLSNGKLSDIDEFQILEIKEKRKEIIERIRKGDWKDIKICYVSTTGQGGRPIGDGSTRYRCYHPAEALSSKGAFVTVVPHGVFLKALSYQYDIYVFHRPCKAEIPIITSLKNLGKILIADYDDLIFGNQEVAMESSIYKNLKRPLESVAQNFIDNMSALYQFDYISLSTEGLKKEERAVYFKGQSFVVHNFIPDSILRLAEKYQVREVPKDKNLLMYCTGTLSHNLDFVQVEEVLLSCLEKDKNLKLLIFGVLAAPEKFQKTGRVFFHNVVDYWNLFDSMSPAAFTIAPLEMPSRFNECKSNVKFLESSVAGATLFATPIGDMTRVQKAGIKLCYTAKDWEDAILNRNQIDITKNIKQNLDFIKHNCSTDTFIKEFTNIFNNMEI